MFDFEIAFFLYKISKILAIFEDNKFRSEAFFKAAMAVDAYGKYAEFLAIQNRLTDIDGIGDSSAKIIEEIIETGSSKYLKELEEKYKIEDYSLILSHGISNKDIKKLFDDGITTFDKLKQAELDLKASRLLLYIQEQEQVKGKYLFSYAYCLGGELVELVNTHFKKEVVQFDLSSWSDKVISAKINCLEEYFVDVKKFLADSLKYSSVEHTDSQITCETKFGLPVIIRFVGELSQSKQGTPLFGDLHMHTTWSDGKHGIYSMYESATKLGREYVGITDHSYSLKVANGISEVDAIKQIEEIRELNKKGAKILAGIEVEILKDGSLDFSDAVLSQFDFVIAAIHSHLTQKTFELEARISKALSNLYVSIFAHPTSKLLGRPGVMFSERKSYGVNISKIIELCKQNNVVLEFNSFPERFDIGEEHFALLEKSGVMLAVGTDAHSAAHLNCLDYAEIALRGYSKLQEKVINTFNYKKALEFFKKQRESKVGNDFQEATLVTKDFWHFFSNNNGIMSGKDTFIGIDLTGSEGKPSGWAVMNCNKAKTAILYTDDDIINETIKHNPTIISIDSPLTYPIGRCCDKKDCECRKFGIMRYCELLLRHFGIGVYPCLIDNMVDLTNRGIRIAKRFGELGYKVIESYPGVAQDILNIKRKQNGIGHLINGYKSFGIVGDYLNQDDLKHDELDAIASALVGLFYANGQYVALGNEAEDYLIVPSVAEKPKRPIVIGIAGEIGVGKTTLTEYLKFKYGFKSFRYSQVIKKLYNCDDSRETLQRIGAEIASDSKKQAALTQEIIKEIEASPDRNYVIDGLRHVIDYDMLSQHFDTRFELIFIDSTVGIMHKRYISRSKRDMTREEFLRILNRASEKEIPELRYKHKIPLENKKTFKEFFENFENIYKELIKKCQ